MADSLSSRGAAKASVMSCVTLAALDSEPRSNSSLSSRLRIWPATPWNDAIAALESARRSSALWVASAALVAIETRREPMAASTDDDEARRLAELIGGDSDSDEEETDADRLRMAQLLGRRGISDEASDDDDAPVVTTPALVPRAPPAPPQLVVLPPEVRSGTKRNPEVGGIGATTAEGPGLAAACDALASMESRAASLPPCVIQAGSVCPRPRPCAIFF